MGVVRGPGSPAASFERFALHSEAQRATLSELLASSDDALLDAFVRGDGLLSEDRLHRALADQTAEGLVHPVFFGSASRDIGVTDLLSGIEALLPAAAGDADAPAPGRVFKIERTASGERVAFVRMFAGSLRPRQRVRVGGDEQAKPTSVKVFAPAGAPRRDTVVAGEMAAIRGLGAVAQRPYVLVTRNPAVRTIRDFGPGDRIAVPALKLSGPAVMLEMAAAQEWGIGDHQRLARLAVAMPDESAAAALIAGKGEITAHFSRTPYVDRELGEQAISRVMDSFDIAGMHSSSVLATTMRFRDGSPELCKAVLSALQQAAEFIEKSPGGAAEIFAEMASSDDTPPEDLADMIGDPDLVYAAAPAGVMRIADFMHRTGRLRRRPADWRELFLPEARDLAGS
jgi:NitT/TauT family transport system substrate-binding protein